MPSAPHWLLEMTEGQDSPGLTGDGSHFCWLSSGPCVLLKRCIEKPYRSKDQTLDWTRDRPKPPASEMRGPRGPMMRPEAQTVLEVLSSYFRASSTQLSTSSRFLKAGQVTGTHSWNSIILNSHLHRSLLFP